MWAGTSSAASGEAGGPAALRRGLALYREGRHREAMPLLKEGLETSPEHLEGHLALARIHLVRRDWERAIPAAERAVAPAPASSEAHLALAQAYGTKARDVAKVRALFLVDDIREHFEKAVELDPRNLDAREGLVQFYVQAPALVGGDAGKARPVRGGAAPRPGVRGRPHVSRRAAAVRGRGAPAWTWCASAVAA